jgi:small multidrug resistance pump
MKPWLFLGGAILTEVTATMALRGATDHSALFAIVVVGYLVSFAFMAKVLDLGMPLGVAYGIWGATGVALTAVLGTLLFDEAFTAAMGGGIVLIIAGVLLIEFGHQRAVAGAGGSHE